MKILLITGLIAMLLMSMALVLAEDNDSDISEFAEKDLSNISEGTLISPNPIENTTAEQTVDQETADEINDELDESVSAFDITRAKIGLWFAFSQEKKAEKELKLARMELIRAKIAARNNNTAAMEKALDAHDQIIARIQERINAIDGKITEKGIKNSAEKLVGLERAIQVHEARIAKLREILADGNLTEDQVENIQARLDQAENNTSHLKEIEAAKIDKLKERLKAVTDMSEEEVNAEIQKIEDAQNLSAVRSLVKEIKAARNENAAQVISEVIAKLEARQNETNNNMNNAIEKLTIVQEKLQNRAENLRERNGNSREDTEEEQLESEDNETEVEEPETELENESEED